MIENLPKGAVPDPHDPNDLSAAPILSALPPVDWTKEFRLQAPPNEDQGQSLSCVAQAWSYYHWQLDPKDYSRRDLYCRIFLPQGGAYIRDGGKEIVGSGQTTRDKMPDPQPETESGMRDATGLNINQEAANKENGYFALPNSSIDGVAAGIAAYKGVVFGVNGTNEGWQNMEVPTPPAYGTNPEWGHALYAMGYHMHDDGQKCIIAKSSWCNEVTEHHIRQTYFLTGNTFSPWTLIPKEQIMVKKFIINDNGKYGIMILEGFTGSILFADSEAHLTELCDANGIPSTTPTITVPQ